MDLVTNFHCTLLARTRFLLSSLKRMVVDNFPVPHTSIGGGGSATDPVWHCPTFGVQGYTIQTSHIFEHVHLPLVPFAIGLCRQFVIWSCTNEDRA